VFLCDLAFSKLEISEGLRAIVTEAVPCGLRLPVGSLILWLIPVIVKSLDLLIGYENPRGRLSPKGTDKRSLSILIWEAGV
jgi:hypothetical protein